MHSCRRWLKPEIDYMCSAKTRPVLRKWRIWGQPCKQAVPAPRPQVAQESQANKLLCGGVEIDINFLNVQISSSFPPIWKEDSTWSQLSMFCLYFFTFSLPFMVLILGSSKALQVWYTVPCIIKRKWYTHYSSVGTEGKRKLHVKVVQMSMAATRVHFFLVF